MYTKIFLKSAIQYTSNAKRCEKRNKRDPTYMSISQRCVYISIHFAICERQKTNSYNEKWTRLSGLDCENIVGSSPNGQPGATFFLSIFFPTSFSSSEFNFVFQFQLVLYKVYRWLAFLEQLRMKRERERRRKRNWILRFYKGRFYGCRG